MAASESPVPSRTPAASPSTAPSAPPASPPPRQRAARQRDAGAERHDREPRAVRHTRRLRHADAVHRDHAVAPARWRARDREERRARGTVGRLLAERRLVRVHGAAGRWIGRAGHLPLEGRGAVRTGDHDGPRIGLRVVDARQPARRQLGGRGAARPGSHGGRAIRHLLRHRSRDRRPQSPSPRRAAPGGRRSTRPAGARSTGPAPSSRPPTRRWTCPTTASS